LIDKEEINTITRLRSFSKPKEIYEQLYQYVSKHPNSCLTWRLCLGSNHSFKRCLLDKVGGYDEDFRGWGVEDTEFAYRLYKAGAQFVINPKLFRYHQEHPISSKKKSEQSKNRMLLKQKHPDIDIYITSLLKIKTINMEFMERVLREHKALSRNFRGQFKDFKSAIILLLQQIDQLVLEKKPLQNLLRTSGINNDPKRKIRIYSERKKIIAYGKYKNLVRLFDILKDI
jgi:predicted glycosyltransferase involved in capsule biosynthesis